jgi:DNA-binding HxlR family transcriptional regulator
MQRTSFEAMNCSVAQCLEVIGEWWSMLIIRDAFLGVRRFDDFQSRLGISRNILTARLSSLVEAGVLEKVPYQERPLRHEYRLTDKGRDLWPVLTTMREWGDRWAAPDGAPLELVHDACGEVMYLAHTCRACGEPVDHRSVHARPGPGARPNDFAGTALVAPPLVPMAPRQKP